MSKKISKLNHKQGLSLASIAVIALAIPLGIMAVQQPQILSSLAAPKSLDAPPTSECRVTGCGNELCVDADYVPLESNCSYKDRFSCYAQASCALQPDGECGFIISPEVQSCLDQYGVNTNPNQPYFSTQSLSTGTLNKTYSDIIQADSRAQINYLSISALPDGLNAECTQDTCTISGTPTQTGRYQVVALASSGSGKIEQQLIPLTIRAGGTLKRQ